MALLLKNREGDIVGHTNTKKMVQGAMIAAIFGVFSLLNTYTGGMIDILLCYVMVVPIVWYGYMYTIKDSIIVSIAAMIVVALVGLPLFIISSFSSCVAGVFIGEALRRKAKKQTVLLGTLCVTFVNNLMLYEVFSGLLGMDIVAEMTEIYTMMAPMVDGYISLSTFLSLIPIVLLIMSLLEMYVIILLCQLILSRLKVEFPGAFHIAFMHLSQKTGIILIVLVIGSYLCMNVFGLQSLYFNYIYMLAMMTLMVQGMSFLSWLCIMKRKVFLNILALIGLMIPILNMFYIGIGIIDIFSDLRKKLLYNNHINDEKGG